MALLGKVTEPELTMGFLAACLPVLPTFLRTFFRTSAGRKVRGLWTSSPLTETRQTGAGPHATVGSNAKFGGNGTHASRITRKSQVDIEFAQLTVEEMGTEDSRSNSMRSLVPDVEKGGRMKREEVWSESLGGAQGVTMPRAVFKGS